MSYSIVNIVVYLLCFIASFWGISSIKFENICYVDKPGKVQLLMFLLAMGLAYLVGTFLLKLTIYS